MVRVIPLFWFWFYDTQLKNGSIKFELFSISSESKLFEFPRLKKHIFWSFKKGIFLNIYSSMHAYPQSTEHVRRNFLSKQNHQNVSLWHFESETQLLES